MFPKHAPVTAHDQTKLWIFSMIWDLNELHNTRHSTWVFKCSEVRKVLIFEWVAFVWLLNFRKTYEYESPWTIIGIVHWKLCLELWSKSNINSEYWKLRYLSLVYAVSTWHICQNVLEGIFIVQSNAIAEISFYIHFVSSSEQFIWKLSPYSLLQSVIVALDTTYSTHNGWQTYNIQYSFRFMYSVWPYPKIINIIRNNELIIACPCPTSWLICWKWKQKCNYCWWIWSFSTNIFFQSIFMGLLSLSRCLFWVLSIEHTRPMVRFVHTGLVYLIW